MTGAVSNAVAGCFGLAAFAVAVVAGLGGGNTATSILLRALIAMIVCYPIGLVIGMVCQHVVEQHVRQRAEEAPAPRVAEQSAENAKEAGDALVI